MRHSYAELELTNRPNGRDCVKEALVIGDEPLMGLLPIEALDLIVDPNTQSLIPAHPEGPIALVN
jgi:hypothetical protein